MRLRTGIGFALLLALLTAAGLASAPGAHEFLHPGRAHECAATLFAGGNCDHVSPPLALVAASRLPAPALLLLDQVSRFVAPPPRSVLEHAPPLAS